MQPRTEPDIYLQHIVDTSWPHHLLAGLPKVTFQVAIPGPQEYTLQ